jgi:PAS domain S-box-containing protein
MPTRGIDRVADIRAALRGAGTDVWEWDIDSDILSDTDLGFELLGYDDGEVPRTQAAWVQLIHPDDRDNEQSAYQRHMQGQAPMYESSYRIRAKDGSWRWFEERGRIVEWHPDGRPRRMLGTQSDVTAQRELSQAADAAMQRLERIAQHVPGLLFQFRRTPEGWASFPYISDRCEPLLGVPAAALQADAVAMLRLVDVAQRQQMLDSIATSARSLDPWWLQFSIWRGGVQRWLRGSASPQRGADGALLWHGYMEDVTELIALEQAQRDKAAAEAANRAKTVFLSRISHELRTPLNAVLGFTQLLEMDRSDPLSAGQARRMQRVRESGAHLLQMIGDLLDLTRIESGNFPLAVQAVPLAAALAEAVAMLQPAAVASGVQVSTELAAPVAAQALSADPTRLRQVLLNLLGNAIKYNLPGGQVVLAARPADAGSVMLSVSDTGPGIAAADLPRVFEPFFRADAARHASDGAGIGLALSRALVEQMGGQISVVSTPGVGSTFSVLLPSTS